MDMIQIQDNPSPQFNTLPPTETPQVEKPPLDLSSSYLQKKNPFSKKSKAAANVKCPSHPEENLQFYCFDNKSLLCTECLARGGYSGLDVMNIKRAAERVKEKLRGNVQVDGVKAEDFYLVEKEMEGHEAQIEKTIFNYKREVKEKMDILRSAIDKKEQEALEKINRVHEGKLKAIKDVLSSFKVLKGEIESNRSPKDQNLDNLTDIDLCQYYSTKTEFVDKSSSNDDIAAKIEKAKRLIEVQQSRDQICFTKFDEEFRRVQSYIENFSVDIGIKKSLSISPTAITESDSSSKYNFTNRYSAYSILEDRKSRKKEQDDSSAKLKAPSPRPTSAQKNQSYLTKAGSNEETATTPRTPAKQSTPRSTFLAEKSIGFVGLKRDSSQKSFSGKPGGTQPVFPTNYKDWLTQQVKAKIGSTTPKGSAREEVPSPSINSFRTGIPSNKGLIDSFYVSKSLIKPESAVAKTMLETSIDQTSLYRTTTDLQASHREQMSLTNKIMSKNEGLGGFDFDNPFASKKGQNPIESILSSESRLKEKLKKLNSQIFK